MRIPILLGCYDEGVVDTLYDLAKGRATFQLTLWQGEVHSARRSLEDSLASDDIRPFFNWSYEIECMAYLILCTEYRSEIDKWKR